MKVFLSWSGQRSHMVAELLDEWLRCVIQASEPWLSSEGIERGSVWFTEISGRLSDTTVGIICLTEENKNKPWILFEAGAISKGLSSSRVCTFLIDLKHQDVQNPLAQFNHTEATREGVWNLVLTINTSMGERALRDAVLKKVFDTHWPEFEGRFASILQNTPAPQEPKKRQEGEILTEMLEAVRSMERRMLRLEERGGVRQEVTGNEEKRRGALGLNRREAMEFIKTAYGNGLGPSETMQRLMNLGMTAEQAIDFTLEHEMRSGLLDSKVPGQERGAN